jgi:hypothetical protein
MPRHECGRGREQQARQREHENNDDLAKSPSFAMLSNETGASVGAHVHLPHTSGKPETSPAGNNSGHRIDTAPGCRMTVS